MHATPTKPMRRAGPGPRPEPLTDPVLAARVRTSFAVVLHFAGAAGLVQAVWMQTTGAPHGAVARAVVIGAAALLAGSAIWRGAAIGAVTNSFLAAAMAASATSMWARGLGSSLMPMLIVASPVATSVAGPRSGRAWMALSLGLLAMAALRSPALVPGLMQSQVIVTGLATLVGGGVVILHREAHEAQQRRIAAATRALREEKQAAQQASRAKSTFLATMSHEIRTPLNAVIGLADLLADRPLPAEDVSRVRQIQRSGTLLLDLLNDVLDMSQIESGETRVQPEPVDLRQLLERVADVLGGRAEAQGLELAMRVDAALPERVVVDPTRTRQILVNLISNAIKFTPQGEVSVEVSVPAAGRLQVTVTDTGVGIPESAQQHIFERFRQADEGRDRAFGGSGLGLAISRTLAEMMGGSLRLVWSRVGEGSCFALSLPWEASPASASAPEPGAPELTRGQLVLVVDDDPVNRMVVQAQLRSLGFKTAEVSNGAEAVRLMAGPRDRPPVGLILMDQQMPVMDGITATVQLRSAGVALPIVALTANAFSEDRAACLEAGMDAFLTKPVSRARLDQILKALLADPGRAETNPPPLP